MTACPLSGSTDLQHLEDVRTADLVALYRRVLKTDVTNELGGAKTLALHRCNDCDLRFFTPSTPGSEKLYEQLQRFEWYYRDFKTEYRFAARFVRPEDRVLDVGCGYGAFGLLSPSKDYTGLELSGTAVVQARAAGLDVRKETIETHAAANAGQYDVVCSFQVLEHLREPLAFVQAALQCLRPGGHLILSVPSVDSYSSMMTNFVLDLPPHHVTRWSDRTLERLAELTGAEHVETWHEPLPDNQRPLFVSEVLRYRLRKMFGAKEKAVDDTLSFRFFGLASRLLARTVGAAFMDERIGARGVFAAAAYRKRA